jgi:hypothetical protein
MTFVALSEVRVVAAYLVKHLLEICTRLLWRNVQDPDAPTFAYLITLVMYSYGYRAIKGHLSGANLGPG